MVLEGEYKGQAKGTQSVEGTIAGIWWAKLAFRSGSGSRDWG